MLRTALGNFVSYLLSAWFVLVFTLIVFAGIAFLITLLYHIVV